MLGRLLSGLDTLAGRMLAFGPLSDFIPIEWMLAGTGLLVTVQTLFLLKNKTLLAIGRS